jgi:SPP1 gp7 family putative phage head morphogenesis protein
MCKDCGKITTHSHTSIQVNVDSIDPTRTLTLRGAWVSDSNRRFNELAAAVRTAVDTNDVFGLREETVTGFLGTFTVNQVTIPPVGSFAFPRSEDKVKAFMKWLREQERKGIIEIEDIPQIGQAIEQPWTNKYVRDSYKRGVLRARSELRKAGFTNVPSIEASGGIDVVMGTPFHVDRLGLLYTRTFSELEGISAAMDREISRILAQGIADGDGPRLLARKLTAAINGTGLGDLSMRELNGRPFMPARRRAEIMARTETIRAHHQATIQEYRNWAVEGVIVVAEFITAGDDRVCQQCNDLAGNGPLPCGAYPLDEIEPMIPVHAQCRCIALPFKPESCV